MQYLDAERAHDVDEDLLALERIARNASDHILAGKDCAGEQQIRQRRVVGVDLRIERLIFAGTHVEAGVSLIRIDIDRRPAQEIDGLRNVRLGQHRPALMDRQRLPGQRCEKQQSGDEL